MFVYVQFVASIVASVVADSVFDCSSTWTLNESKESNELNWDASALSTASLTLLWISAVDLLSGTVQSAE